MTNNILQEIHARYGKFTRVERQVADVVLERPDQVVYMSITGLVYVCVFVFSLV